MAIFDVFLSPQAWIALLTLAFMEVVLGIDNIVFLSLTTSKLPPSLQSKARVTGLLLAMLGRIGLLFCISLLMRLTVPIFHFSGAWVSGSATGQSIVVAAGGLFLLYKSVSNIHEEIAISKEDKNKPIKNTRHKATFWGVIAQVVVMDLVFSFDSVLTAVGIISFRTFGYGGGMLLMVVAIMLAVVIMLFFSKAVSNFVNKYPSIQMLALSFLILISVMLFVEAAHLAGISIMGTPVGEIPRGYIYFAIAFSLLVEMLNLKLSKKK